MPMLETYLYFNKPQINHMYAQIMGWVPTDRVKNDSHTFKGGLTAGIFGTGVKAGGAKESGTRELLTISEEQKLREIKSHLRKNNQLHHGIDRAVAYVLKNNVSIFVQAKYRFDAPQFRDSSDPENSVNEGGGVLLECYVGSTRILTSLGVNHLVRGSRMTKLRHDAIHLHAFHGKEIPLEIFGVLHPLPTIMQIRPITVSFL